MSKQETETLLHEVKILSEMDHPNIVRLYEFYDEELSFCMVMEPIKGGELFDAIIEVGNFAEDQAKILIKAVLSCLNYCHL
jgi:serine/threonine protein kinase